MDEMYKIAQEGKYIYMKCKKLVMDEMYEIGQFSANFEYEYSRICVVSVVRA